VSTDKWKYLTARFVALYLLLGVVVLASVAGAVAFSQVQYVKHDVAVVKASLGDQNLARIATAYISRQAALQSLTNVRVTVLKVSSQGDVGTVKLRVAFVDPYGSAQTATLNVKLTRGVWNATGASTA
jgi:hypothetical protein